MHRPDRIRTGCRGSTHGKSGRSESGNRASDTANTRGARGDRELGSYSHRAPDVDAGRKQTAHCWSDRIYRHIAHTPNPPDRTPCNNHRSPVDPRAHKDTDAGTRSAGDHSVGDATRRRSHLIGCLDIHANTVDLYTSPDTREYSPFQTDAIAHRQARAYRDAGSDAYSAARRERDTAAHGNRHGHTGANAHRQTQEQLKSGDCNPGAFFDACAQRDAIGGGLAVISNFDAGPARLTNAHIRGDFVSCARAGLTDIDIGAAGLSDTRIRCHFDSGAHCDGHQDQPADADCLRHSYSNADRQPSGLRLLGHRRGGDQR